MKHLFEALKGQWTGINRLYTTWLPQKEHISNSLLSAREVAQGKFLELTYSWSHEGKDQEGVLLLGHDTDKNIATAAWIDSWHQSSRVMALSGSVDDEGAADLLGSYEAPPDPNWLWRIIVTPISATEMGITMFTFPPGGKEEVAVRMDYRRAQA